MLNQALRSSAFVNSHLHRLFAFLIALHSLEFPIIYNSDIFSSNRLSAFHVSGLILLLVLQTLLVMFIVYPFVIKSFSQINFSGFSKIGKWLIFSGVALLNCGMAFLIATTSLFS